MNRLNIERSASHTPIFQTFIDYRQGQREKQAWADCQLELMCIQNSKVGYDVSLDIIDDPAGSCRVTMMVRKDLFGQAGADRLARSYSHLIKEFATNPDFILSEPDLFSVLDVEETVGFSNGPVFSSHWPATLAHRIEDMAQEWASEIAVQCGEEVQSYQELVDQTNTIAAALKKGGANTGVRVAVLQEPTASWVSSILAIWKVGAIYVPVDLSNPDARMSSILEDCEAKLLLVSDNTLERAQAMVDSQINLINVNALEADNSSTEIMAERNDVATILYTSGSTGTPKGIILTHDNLRNCIEAVPEVVNISRERVLQQSSSGFDMSIFQICTALCHGGSVHLIPRQYRSDSRYITSVIKQQDITLTCACPSEYDSWFTYGEANALSESKLRTAICGGENIEQSLLDGFELLEKKDLRVFNFYGPTELSFAASAMELVYRRENLEKLDSIAAGFPLSNYSVYVLDEHLHRVPVGVLGEIYVGGLGVSQGYLNKEELTVERFVEDVFATGEQQATGWTKMHRTGDMGRWNEDGSLIMEGRIAGDTQVKVRGQRFDLREVESALITASEGVINQAVATHQNDLNGVETIIAHVKFDDKASEDEQQTFWDTIQSRLRIPQYMQPSLIVPVASFPMTSSSKLDRKAVSQLPLPSRSETSHSDDEAELTETERDLLTIWSEVITSRDSSSLEHIRPSTDFFHIGGNSLLLLGLREKIRAKFGTELILTDMFDASTLSGMAKRIAGQATETANQGIDWQRESALPADFLSANVELEEITPCEKKTVVLTGATGYLGRAILDALIEDASVDKIHCIAVRNAMDRGEMMHLAKVVLHEGDLVSPRLGLSERVAGEIFSSTDLIIHNGADVSFMKTYASLRSPNVDSTKELLRMSFPRLIPFHYISTGATCSFMAEAGITEASPAAVSDYPPPKDGAMGYTSSKWASEVVLENAHAEVPSWPLWVHRPSWIERTGAPELDFTQNLRHYSQLMKAVPAARGLTQGGLDLVTLEQVITGLINCFHSGPNPVNDTDTHDTTKDSLQFVHHIGGIDLPFNDIAQWASSEGEDDSLYEELSFEEWARRAQDQGMHPTFGALMRDFGVRGQSHFVKLLRE